MRAIIILTLLAPLVGASTLLPPLFTEDFESGADRWTFTNSGGWIECGEDEQGCYLHNQPVCCRYNYQRAEVGLPLHTPVTVAYKFRTSTLSGDMDTIFRVELGDDMSDQNDVDVSFTGWGSRGNNGLYLHSWADDDGSRSIARFGNVAAPNVWYTLAVEFDPLENTVIASLLDDAGNALTTSEPRGYDSSATTIAALSTHNSLWTTYDTSGSFDLDDIRIHLV